MRSSGLAQGSQILDPLISFKTRFVAKGEQESIAFQELIASEEFIYVKSFRDQVGIACKYLHNDEIRVSFERLGELWGKHKFSIMHQYKKYSQGVMPTGRPALLTDIESQVLKSEIERYFAEEGNPTYEYLSDFIQEKKSTNIFQLNHCDIYYTTTSLSTKECLESQWRKKE